MQNKADFEELKAQLQQVLEKAKVKVQELRAENIDKDAIKTASIIYMKTAAALHEIEFYKSFNTLHKNC